MEPIPLPTVVLLHAWGETPRVFDRLVPLLRPDLQVVVPDLSEVGDGAVGHVRALVEALDRGPCWLLGTSSGGYLAQQVALAHPQVVRGLVLVGTPSDLSALDTAAVVDLVDSFQDPVSAADVDSVTTAIGISPHVPASFLADQRDAAMGIPKRAWQAGLAALISAVPPIRTGTIAVPTLILWGTDDDVVPAEQADELQRAIVGSRLVAYDGVGHLVLWEAPERVARDTVAFIAPPR